LAVIAASETVEASLKSVVEIEAWLGDIVFDALVMFAIAAPLLYFAAIRPLAQRFAAHAALARTALEQEAALKASHERLALAEYAETVVASVPAGLAVLTTELVVVSANRALRDMFSLTDRDLIGQPLEKVLPGVNRWRLAAEVLGSDQPSPTISVDVPEANGVRHLYVRLTRLRQGAELRLLLVVEDITPRIQLQEQLHAERSRFWGILDAASDAIISVDEAHRIIVFNQQAEHLFGYASGEAIGQPLAMLLPSRFRADHDDRMRAFRREAVSSRNANSPRNAFIPWPTTTRSPGCPTASCSRTASRNCWLKPGADNRRSLCCTWIWTVSNSSTIRWDTPPGINSSRPWPNGSQARSARAIRCAVSAATSSP
jgi:PAS domain S-box-containing protein